MKSGISILVVEDDAKHAQILALILRRSGYDVELATSFEEGRDLLALKHFDLVLTDLDLGAHRGTEILKLARARDPDLEVVVVSGVARVEDAVEAMQMGAVTLLTKPLDSNNLRKVLSDVATRIHARRRAGGLPAVAEEVVLEPVIAEQNTFEGLIGKSLAMQRVFATIRQIAPTNATVLIQGEPGTGKELVAQAIHHLSPRTRGPFVAINCGALSQGILDSELFGHEKGAFTGATRNREGKFEYASGGTLFLDEVGEMPLGLQVKLLRVIQEREVVRLGSNQSIKVDVRLLAATNKNLEREIQEGNFREDLYWRLKVVTIDMPPLRERPEEIPLMARHFLRDFCLQHGRSPLTISRGVMAVLCSFGWPGNVRQLQNVMETMALLSPGPELAVEDLPPEIKRQERIPSKALVTRHLADLTSMTLQEWERELIRMQLTRLDGNRAKAARALGISERTLYRKLREYGLS